MKENAERFDWASTDLEELRTALWRRLETGAHEAGDAWHTPVFTTAGEPGPEARTVVLRGVETARRYLVLHTHLASEKVAEIGRQPLCQWLFYSAEEKLQLRLLTRATIHHGDEVAAADWERTSLSSRRIYCTVQPPGAEIPPVEGPVSGLPPELEARQPTEEESRRLGWPNFVVIRTEVRRMEFLYLRAAGHRRAAWEWPEHGDRPRACWLVP
ncbi:MAG: pyridoxamine 5'-phosphate oxidase [Verrucomicrobiota bacterium]